MGEIKHVQQAIILTRQEVLKKTFTTAKRKPTIADYVQLIEKNLYKNSCSMSWRINDVNYGFDTDLHKYAFRCVLNYVFTSTADNSFETSDWFICGDGETQAEAYHNAIFGAKEKFMVYFFGVPQRELDPANLMKAEYEERAISRAAETKTLLDQIHAKVQTTLFEHPERRKEIDTLVMEFARVGGKPSTSYYTITEPEVAGALKERIDALLDTGKEV